MSSDVIDVDAHIRESNNDIRAYLPEPYCKRGSPLLASDGMWAGEGTNSDHSDNPDIATRLGDMDREGISVAVLFPTKGKIRGQIFIIDSRLRFRLELAPWHGHCE